jgi:hypothetical protein
MYTVHYIQFDSPGYSAQYCFYSLMDSRGLVISFYVASKQMVTYSSNMGRYYFLFFLH